MRKVSPWTAAFLSLFFGWGMGHFYAGRTKTALALTAAAVAAHILFCLGMYWLSVRGIIPPPRPFAFDWRELGTIRVSVPVEAIPFAIWAAVSAAQRPLVKRASPLRLWGYVALWLGPILLFLSIAPVAPWEGGWSLRFSNGRFEFD
jgi:hypothetical protein